MNRTVEVNPLQTVEDYFKNDTWEVAVVEVIYLIHLYSAFGEFLLVAKYRDNNLGNDFSERLTWCNRSRETCSRYQKGFL